MCISTYPPLMKYSNAMVSRLKSVQICWEGAALALSTRHFQSINPHPFGCQCARLTQIFKLIQIFQVLAL